MYVNASATNRAGGDARVTLKKVLGRPPQGFSGIQAHGLTSLENVKFYEEVDVVDPDDPNKVFHFNLNGALCCPCQDGIFGLVSLISACYWKGLILMYAVGHIQYPPVL